MRRAETPSSVLLAAALAALAGCTQGDAPPAETLGAVAEFPSPAPPGSAEPNLAVDPDGRVYLSWIEPADGSGHALRFAVLHGGQWSTPRTIARGSDWFVNWADFPSVLPLPDGRLAAHWLQKSGPGTYAYDVRIAQSADGGATWSAPVTPHRDGTQTEHGFVSLWPARGDSLAAVWLDGRKYAAAHAGEEDGNGAAAGEMSLMFATVAADGTLGAERPLDARTCDCCQTSAALTSQGPVVVYRDRSADEVRDVYVTRLVDGAWTTPVPVHADGWVMPACPVNGPAVSARGTRVAVAWFTRVKDTPRAYVAFSADAGATFGAPARVDGGDPEGRMDVEVLADGGALVSWLERTGDQDGEIRVRRVSPDGRVGDPRVVARSSTRRSSGFPRMIRSGGEVVFAWTVPDEPSAVRVARAPLQNTEP